LQRRHFETLRPVCPVCDTGAPLKIERAIREEGDDLVEGILVCSNERCRREYPVIDGIPILVAAIRGWLAANPLQVLQRDDLSAEIESLLGDVLGSGSAFDTQRQHTGIYAGTHYGDGAPPLETLLPPLDGPALDIGCATGGTTFRIAARSAALTLGVDLNFAMLRIAARALREGRVRYARRRVGLVYDRVEREVDVPARELVDFWCCDAAALPFAPATFGAVASLNLLDCTATPAAALAALARVLRPGGTAVIATPYDWSASATPVENWIGGHSQRGPHAGASEPLLRALLEAEGLEIVSEEENVPWSVRLHDRSRVEYGVHAIVARRAR
jgi:SAM-dependent methyltransferase/uncharacterized protein YbaR (Trm112 family)